MCGFGCGCCCPYRRRCRCYPARPWGDMIGDLIGWSVGLCIFLGGGALMLASL